MDRNQSASQYPPVLRAPFVDPNTGIVYQCSDADVQGWLTKQSEWLKDWRRRFFLLKGSKLFFCKNEYAGPHGMIDLSTCTTVKSADIKSGKIYSFEISTPETTYLMYADSEKEKDDWIGFVGRAIVRTSVTYLENEDVKNPNGGGAGTSNGLWGDGDEVDYDELYENEDHPYFND